jgi:hypothetical protein
MAQVYAAVERCETAAQFRIFLKQVAGITNGPERLELRRKRIGVLGAGWRRPSLWSAIGRAQASRTTDFQRAVALAQAKGFITRDMTARSVAVVCQAVLFGRIISDIDAEGPLSDEDWTLSHPLIHRTA